MSSDLTLQIDRLGVSFGGLRAVDSLSFDVSRGEIVGLIGPNGAGKTTVFNAISKFVAWSEGDIRVNDSSLRAVRPERVCQLGVGRTFQHSHVIGELTVEENVSVAARYGSSRLNRVGARTLVESALEQTALTSLAKIKVADVSLFDVKRVELARAIATGAGILLIDEILSGLTAGEADRAVEMVTSVQAEGRGLLVIEHNMRALMQIADRIVVMVSGRMIAMGSPRNVASDQAVIDAYLGADDA